ncbi:MAG: tetratricopeptide repeat protein [Chthoniobacterales bacterium]
MALSTIAHCAPFIPKNGSEILERLRDRPLDSAARQVRQLQHDLARDPRNLALATDIASRYVVEARRQGDPRYLGYAQGVLGPWWTLPQPPSSVLVLRATIRQSNHDFDAALADLSQALEIVPNNAQAWLTRANILQVKGEYEAALQSCERLSVFAPHFATETCLASVASMMGQAEASYKRLQQILAHTPTLLPVQKAWMETGLAEIATRLDMRSTAEAHFKRALDYGENDPYLKSAYADFLLDSGRPAEVVRLLSADTRNDGLLLRLALADQAQDAPELKDRIATLQARFDAARGRDDSVHLREKARFYTALVRKPHEAVRLAQANWAVQKEPVDARVLLEAALAAAEPSAAQPVVDWMSRYNVEDAALARLIQRLRP